MSDIIQITRAEYGEMFLFGLIAGASLASLLWGLMLAPRRGESND